MNWFRVSWRRIAHVLKKVKHVKIYRTPMLLLGPVAVLCIVFPPAHMPAHSPTLFHPRGSAVVICNFSISCQFSCFYFLAFHFFFKTKTWSGVCCSAGLRYCVFLCAPCDVHRPEEICGITCSSSSLILSPFWAPIFDWRLVGFWQLTEAKKKKRLDDGWWQNFSRSLPPNPKLNLTQLRNTLGPLCFRCDNTRCAYFRSYLSLWIISMVQLWCVLEVPLRNRSARWLREVQLSGKSSTF